MSTINPRFGRLLAGGGGVLLIACLFLPWADGPDGLSRNGWEFLTMSDVLFLIVGLFGIAHAITGGRFGFFRRDLSLSGATDLLGLIAAILLGWLIVFDFPSSASPRGGGLPRLDRGDRDLLRRRRLPGDILVSQASGRRPLGAIAVITATRPGTVPLMSFFWSHLQGQTKRPPRLCTIGDGSVGASRGTEPWSPCRLSRLRLPRSRDLRSQRRRLLSPSRSRRHRPMRGACFATNALVGAQGA